jgi:hypothetical protein
MWRALRPPQPPTAPPRSRYEAAPPVGAANANTPATGPPPLLISGNEVGTSRSMPADRESPYVKQRPLPLSSAQVRRMPYVTESAAP